MCCGELEERGEAGRRLGQLDVGMLGFRSSWVLSFMYVLILIWETKAASSFSYPLAPETVGYASIHSYF